MLKCKFIIGSANNQLDLKSDSIFLSNQINDEEYMYNGMENLDKLLQSNDIFYLPDYIINIGGIYTSICEQLKKDKSYMLKTLRHIIHNRIDMLFKSAMYNKVSFLISAERYLNSNVFYKKRS